MIARLVAAADPRLLLPPRMAREGAVLPQQLRMLAAEPLDDAGWVCALEDTGGSRFAAPVVVDAGHLRRAVAGDGVAEALIGRLARAPAGRSEAGFDWTPTGVGTPVTGERPMGVDQTHESVVTGEEAVVKWCVALSPSPAPRLLSHLQALSFPDVPPPWGFLEHDGRLVAVVDRYLPGARDGWDWCVADLAEVAVAGSAPGTGAAASLGDLTARLHVALATSSAVIVAPVETAGEGQLRDWHTRARNSLAHAVEVVTGDDGDRLRSNAVRAAQVLDELLTAGPTPVMPVHGDLHVGQVLRWDGGYAVTDFDGNPVLPPSQRQQREPAARDVAGMLQSLDHVGRVVVRRVPGASTRAVEQWIVAARDAFLAAYRDVLDNAGVPHLLDERLIRPFAVEQECREYAYAASHLPRWGYVPDAAFAALFAEE